ncbi:hypothetical protein P4668_26890 [Priestia megaterium]|uniref:hypothetical protein n=1 Tax=Priestia megaterium TaxID=1404 RepID=UPI002E1A9084|nr:hypothetical protein [Priestia megaterium]
MQIALEERITGHASYINTGEVLKVLDGIDSTNLSTTAIEMLARISSTFEFLKETLDKVDPWLVSTSTMNNINSPISQVLGEINAYNNDKNEQRLNNILSYLENLLVYLSQLVVPKTSEDIEGVKSSVISFRKSVGQHLGYVERDCTNTSAALTKNTEKLNDLTASIESQKARIDAIINEFQNQFLQSQSQRNEEFTIFTKKGEQDLIGTLRDFQGTFEQQTLTQQETFDSLTEGFQQRIESQQQSFDSLTEGFQQWIENQRESFDTLVADLKTNLQTELDQIKGMNQEAEKILGIMSMKGLAQGYQKIANSESQKAFVWNAISILSLVGILWFGYKFIILHEGAMSWTSLISRIVLTGVGITLFTYCAKQATNHRNEERRNRKIELELASLDPYLKDLEPEKQKEVKQALVDKYFGVELPTANIAQAPVQQQNLTETITNNPQIMQLLAEKVSQFMTKQ